MHFRNSHLGHDVIGDLWVVPVLLLSTISVTHDAFTYRLSSSYLKPRGI